LNPNSQITAGRSTDNHIVINDPEVSGKHLTIAHQPDGSIVVWDNNSTNGTYVNGNRLQGAYRLSPQDVVQLGQFTLRLQ
jgi:pSer/pThr/pTyr-binding forkhead associated (FHA) protein